MRELAKNISAETVRLADAMAIALGNNSYLDAVHIAMRYRDSRVKDASEALGRKVAE